MDRHVAALLAMTNRDRHVAALLTMTMSGHNSARAAEVNGGFAAALADDFAVALKKADEGFGFVEGEGAADAAVGECFVGEDELDAAAGVEPRDHVGQRGLGEIGEAALPGEGRTEGGGVNLLDGGGRGVFREKNALAGGDERAAGWSALPPTRWLGLHAG